MEKKISCQCLLASRVHACAGFAPKSAEQICIYVDARRH